MTLSPGQPGNPAAEGCARQARRQGRQRSLQRIGAYCGAVGIFIYMNLLFVAGLVIPTPPDADSGRISARLVTDNGEIRLCCALGILAAALMLPFFAAITQRIRRAEGEFGMLTLIAAVTMPLNVIGLIYPLTVLSAAAYRAGQRSPEITQALDDLFWLMFLCIVSPVVLESLVLAAATFIDDHGPAALPRWYGYFNLWAAGTAVPGCLIITVNNGPLSWNGVLGYWIPAADFTAWTYVTTYVLLASTRDHTRDDPPNSLPLRHARPPIPTQPRTQP